MYKYIVTPVITEKSTLQSQGGKYHFFVPKDANKIELKKQFEAMYGKPVDSIRIINAKAKKRIVGRGNVILKRKPMKKALVTFKKKESIDINKIK